MRALVFYARHYQFVAQGTGELVTGNNVSYMEVMEPVTTESERGLEPMTVSASPECLKDILSATLPAVCEVEISRRPGRKGKPESVITGFKAGKPWQLQDTLGAAAVAPK